ncbi:hypothetical protein MSPP1_000767 [Malassezia sp. CBS 17886]|nr:hypothetical protein MSPP1_000767 [Malassezia sp. CBS 17886]
MDPFQVRMDFLALLKRLNASQQSIHKIVAFALQYAKTCADDIWDCIMAECEKGSSNTRVNVLFLLDVFLADDFASPAAEVDVYRALALRDLTAIVDMVMPPDSWDAVLNLGSTRQILRSWQAKRVYDAGVLSHLIDTVEERAAVVREKVAEKQIPAVAPLSGTEILQRVEEDRERHKRLRENSWKLPPMSYVHALDNTRPNERLEPMAIEFDELWDNTSDVNEDDLENIREESAYWWGTPAPSIPSPVPPRS